MPNLVKKPWQISTAKIISLLQGDELKGLSQDEAKKRFKIWGANVLNLQKETSLIRLFLRQFISPLIWVLLAAAILAFLFDEWLEGFAILGVIFINAIIGFFMEWQANHSMKALRNLAQTSANVFRDKQLKKIKASDLVPGDLIFLEAGDVVPADCRILEQNKVGIKEAALTGESIPVMKQEQSLQGEVILAEQNNLLFKGTTVMMGNAKAIVFATGLYTELGKISKLAQEAQKATTPLEKKLNKLSMKLLWLTLILMFIILILGIIQGRDIYVMIKTAIALGIATIPEGLPIVATIALSRGMLRLASHQVIVKKLSAVETLGETQVIFTDKTGTLTENQLSVATLGFEFATSNTFFEKNKLQFENPEDHYIPNTFAFEQIKKIASLCNNASLNYKKNSTANIGDPLEIALLKFTQGNGTSLRDYKKDYPRLKEIPFDSNTKMMGTLHKNGKRPDFLVCIKGAMEVVIKQSDYVLTKDGRKDLNNKNLWIERADQLAAKGLRVLGFAYSEINEKEDQFFHNLTFVGFIGFLDPPRPDIKPAIQTCKEAGIKVIMVTGDHPETARNIAFKTGLVDSETVPVFHGQHLKSEEQLTSKERTALLNTNIFARVSPAQKLDLVSIYQNEQMTVGMTGDGINDMPALKKADIGIAMGKRGTEAAKEVADLILENDAFTSIVLAIKLGRSIFQNIRHFVVYLLSCNLSEILVVTIIALFNFDSYLLPLQILFLNMITDVFPALALGMNKTSDHVMHLPPRKPKTPIISSKMWKSIVLYALGLTIAVLAATFYAIYYLGVDEVSANNYTFYTLILAQLWHVFNMPDASQSFFKNEVTHNFHIWMSLITCIIITFIAYKIPVTQEVLNLKSMSWKMFGEIFIFSLFPVLFIQFLKRNRFS